MRLSPRGQTRIDANGRTAASTADAPTRSSRRDELLATAGRMFAEQGLRSTTVRDIADAAGILSGSLYHHFDSKESMVDEILRGDALLVGEHEDRRPVLVGPADHEHVVPGHPHVPAEDVGGDAEPGDVAEMARTVRVRPGDGGEDLAHGDRV